MTRPDPDLIALVGSRIAHDMASPLGAIANGIELLGLTGHDCRPEFALITESVENAKARIKTFRIAFGAAPPGSRLPESEIRTLLAPGVDGRKLVIDWQPTGDPERGPAKLAFLALMCLETAMPWGGNASVRSEGNRWQVSARADRLKLDAPLWDHLTAPSRRATIQAAQIQFALLPRETAAQGRNLQVNASDAAISIAF